MHPDTGHLIDMESTYEGKTGDEINKIKEELFEKGYEEVPESHISAAKKKLSGKSEAYISTTSGGKLSKLLAQKRKEKKQRYLDRLGAKEINRRRDKRRTKNIKK